MPFERDILRQPLGRLGRVPQEILNSSRQRVRGNLEVNVQPKTPLPLPDATPADLTVLRRPYYIGGGMALICLLIASGAVVRSRLERRSAATPAAKSASMQTPESPAAAPSPRSGVETSAPVRPALPTRNKTRPSQAATQPPSAGPAPVEARRPLPRFTVLPPGEGRVILDRACDACHRAAAVGFYHYATRAEYAEVVSRMIAMGAQVSEQDAPVLTDYLFNNLAAKTAQEADTAGPK